MKGMNNTIVELECYYRIYLFQNNLSTYTFILIYATPNKNNFEFYFPTFFLLHLQLNCFPVYSFSITKIANIYRLGVLEQH